MIAVTPITMSGTFAPLAEEFVSFKRAQGYKYYSEAKNGWDRLIPLSESLLKLLRAYRGDTACWLQEDDFFFPAPDRTILSPNTVYQLFRKILWDAGIPYNGKGNGPRLLHQYKKQPPCGNPCVLQLLAV